jgi:protein-L-isoaspartate O-methyltransferase
VHFYELDDERYLDLWRSKHQNSKEEEGLFDAIVFNFAVNESKAKLFATQLLNKKHGILLAPINAMNDYWLKQNYKVINGEGNVLWTTADVGAWSVQFQPDVTQDTCSGVWCAPFNGFQKKK